ncbi:MAG: CCA tRNA nucleotidyltransferase [Chitinophagaceae bacterium]|nr:CCA tRNA nucleotidyltransferase [Oligoflexus sp.]
MNSLKIGQIEAYDPKTDLNYQNARKIIDILEASGFEARMAGGCVRDRLLGITPKDYDVATTASPEMICTLFEQKGFKPVPTGIDHGTITVVVGGKGVEVTSLRRDVSTDGRRAVVAFGSSFEEDSLRRDFTINAMYEDKEGVLYDFHGGRDDLKNGILRFVGDARTRIQEDYLRILRLFRFWARFGFQVVDGTLAVVAEEVRGLEKISQERKTSELLLTLECPHISPVLEAMASSGCLEILLGLQKITPRSDSFWSALILNTKATTGLARLAVLCVDFASKEEQWNRLESLRLSRQQIDAVNVLLDTEGPEPANDPALAYDWLDRTEGLLWVGVWDDFIYPIWKTIRPTSQLEVLNATITQNLARRVCPINGQFLIQNLKCKPGPELGLVLTQIKDGYRRGQWTTKDQALAYAKRQLKLK